MPFVVTADSLEDYPDARPSKVDVNTFAQAFHQASLRAPGVQPGTTCYITYVRPPKPSVTRTVTMTRDQVDSGYEALRSGIAALEQSTSRAVRITSITGVGKPLIAQTRQSDRWMCGPSPFDSQGQAVESALSRAHYDMTTMSCSASITPPNLIIDVTWDTFDVTYDIEQDVDLPYIIFGA